MMGPGFANGVGDAILGWALLILLLVFLAAGGLGFLLAKLL